MFRLPIVVTIFFWAGVVCSCTEEPSRGAVDSSVTADSGDADDLGPVADTGGVPLDSSQADAGPAVDAAGGGDLQQQGDTQPKPTTELLLFDGDNLQFTTADNGFHPLINPGDTLPAANWLTPNDYYNGEFQIRYVIKSPPDQAAGRLQTCIWTMGNGDGDGKNYFPESCSSQVSHTGVGEYFNTKLDPASWWKKDGVPLDFTHPEWFLIRVVLRGTSGCNVTTYNVSNGCWSEWPKYQNMKFRVTIVLVAKGTTFSGWQSYP
jgi:hypothetical protein